MKREIRKDGKDENELQLFIKPRQEELHIFNIDILKLHDMIQSRHTISHQNIHSTKEQENFIEFVLEYQFSPKFVHNDLAKTIIHLLNKTKSNRYVK